MFETLSIEISNDYIKIVEGKRGKRIDIKKAKEIQLSAKAKFIKENIDEDELYEKLNKYLLENNIKRASVSFILSGLTSLLVREITLPYLSEDKVYNLLKYEATQYFPVNIEKFILDYRLIEVVKEDKKAKKQRLLVFAIPKQIIEKIINISDRLKFRINKIDIEVNALSKILDKKELEDNNIMIINIQRSFITSVIIKKGIVQISKTFPMDLDEFYNNKENPEFKSDPLVLNDLLDSILKFLEFYNSREREGISAIWLTGELSPYYNFSFLIQQKTGVKTQLIDQFGFIGKIPENFNPVDYIISIVNLI